jgi:hypothetical protein
MERAAELIAFCNEETVHVPLEFLTYFSKLDDTCCAQVCGRVMPGIINLYSKYYSDGLIGSDIVDLLKIWARVPNNQAFIEQFLTTHIVEVIS